MLTVLQWTTVAVGSFMAVGTLLSLSDNPHWLVRLWDFPRVQIAVLAALSGVAYAVFFHQGRAAEWVFLVATILCALWQIRNILPYTPLTGTQVEPDPGSPRDRRIRLLISNVLMENPAHDRLLRTIAETDPDVVLAVEVDDRWAESLRPLERDYPHVVHRPQDNFYGLVLLSRFPLVDPKVEFLVQDDVPSVRTEVELPSGDRVLLRGLHPRPPEPIRDQDSTPRDAELVLVGRDIGDGPERPTIVMGDLNDVAWSPTTRLFLRLSGLLDPRIGRGFYNSYNARNPIFRYPLDHLFHSRHFRLVELRRVDDIGSDHFPMLVELAYDPKASREQRGMDERPRDEGEAREKLETQADAARTGDDRPGREA